MIPVEKDRVCREKPQETIENVENRIRKDRVIRK